MGQNGLALRGTNDHGRIDFEKDVNASTEGNFRNLIRFRIDAGDNTLKNHLEDCNKNATYLSPLIQNGIIDACGDTILDKIIADVKQVPKNYTWLDIENKSVVFKLIII